MSKLRSHLADRQTTANYPINRFVFEDLRKYPARCAHQTPSSRLESLASVSTKSGEDHFVALDSLACADEDNFAEGVTSLQRCGNKDAGYDPLQKPLV